MLIEPVLASEDELDLTKLTHLANSLLRLMIARVMASDNGKQDDGVMVFVLQVTTNDFFGACILIPT